MIDEGKYVVVWKRVGGQWKLHRDIWTSSVRGPRSIREDLLNTST
jgi:hypothetical protein